MGDLLGYARVSTADQRLDLELDALKTAGCQRVWSDTASGSLTERPELARLFDHLRPGDTLAVWRLDRLGRSVRHLTHLVGGLVERGVGLRSLQEGIDTTTSGGRLVSTSFRHSRSSSGKLSSNALGLGWRPPRLEAGSAVGRLS